MPSETGPTLSSFDPNEMLEPRKRKKQSQRNKAHREDGESNPTASRSRSAFSRIVQLCAVRDRSSKELGERLERDGYSHREIDDALMRAMDCNLVNDDRFADAFIRARVHSGKGPRAIEAELSKHGIDTCALCGWPDAYGFGDDDQVERAVAFISSHPPKAKDQWGLAYRKLVAKGYESDIAYRAVRIWHERETGSGDTERIGC